MESKKVLEEYKTEAEIEKAVRQEVKALSQKLASYKRPLNIFVVEEPMPRTAKKSIKRNDVKKLILK